MKDEEEAAFAAALVNFRLLADSTVRAQFDIEPRDAPAFLQAFNQRGDPAFLVRAAEGSLPSTDERAKLEQTPGENRAYSSEARLLHQSPFFYQTAVWRATGTDDDFQAWCRKQPCSVCAAGGIQSGQPVVFAHVRRASNAGTGIKPMYSGHPCCDPHHQMQHSKGELYVYEHVFNAPSEKGNLDAAKQWYEKIAVAAAYRWCRDSLKQQLGYEHWYDVPPSALCEWAAKNDLEQHLPREYRDAC